MSLKDFLVGVAVGQRAEAERQQKPGCFAGLLQLIGLVVVVLVILAAIGGSGNHPPR